MSSKGYNGSSNQRDARMVGEAYGHVVHTLNVLANPNGVMRHRHVKGIVTEVEGSSPAADIERVFQRRQMQAYRK